ncbi:MAG TPA: PAS domain S-box protein [Terriglobales bacterium]|nr:PAS domain S-box protein [Terriglobales bacterium]
MLAKCSHGDRFSGTYCHLTKNGRTLHVDISGSIFEQHGRLLSLAVAIDVSEKRRAEEELRASEERYRALFDDNLAAMFHAQAGRLLHCNEAMCRMLGYTRSEMKELDLSLLHCDPAAREAARTTLYEKGHLHNHEAELWRKDGSKITVLANLDLVRRGVGEPQIIAGVMLDVTEIRKLQEQLQHSQKMEAIGQLTGGIAHDFNNVLMIINCYCEILSERLTRDNPLYGPVEQIRAAGLRATSLTGQLLAFSRKQVLTPVVMDLAETVTGLKEILKRLIGEDIQLETALTEDICSVTADPNQIEQVLLNLAINARDAMPNGGKLSIGTTVTQLDQEFVRAHPGSKAGEFVVLKVSDTGAGIPFEMQSRVFEPFFTTKEAGKGTGLGLSTVYGIVKQSDGYIRLDSEPGKGATFTIYLPRVHESCEAPPPQSVPATNNLKLTVLLVEDEDPTREALAAYLQQNGCAVLSAANGQRALDICKSIQPNVIDVLLTDVVMPGINGIELSKRLHADFPNLKTLFMSGYTDDVLIRSGMRHSEVVLLPKPFSLPSLLNKLNSLCATAR